MYHSSAGGRGGVVGQGVQGRGVRGLVDKSSVMEQVLGCRERRAKEGGWEEEGTAQEKGLTML